MKKSRYTEEQIIGILKQHEAGVKTADLCREHGISAATFEKRLELAELRKEVAFVSAEFGRSERTACKLLGVDRSSYRYELRPDRNAELREELVKLARQKPRFGYRTPDEFRRATTGYADVETAPRFPHPHSLGGDETISEPNLNRESPVMNG